MAISDAKAAMESYLEICQELGTPPVSQFLACLQDRSRVCRLGSLECEEQLHALVPLLPYAGIEELDLSSLTLKSDGWVALLEGCSKCQSLQVLSLKGCSLSSHGEDAQEQIARHIGTCTVAVLDVSQNGLGDTFLLTLSQLPLVCGGDQLTVLDLSGNAFTDDGIAVLAGIMEVDGLSCQLKQLDCSFNRIEDKGACALAAMLEHVPLLALELEGNQIGDMGCQALSTALRGSLCLQRLNLNHNRFSSETLSVIAESLRVNAGSLQELAVAGATGSEEGMAALLKAACGSKQLQLLDIRGLPLRDQAVDAVCQLLFSQAPLLTLRLDVANTTAAEAVAQAVPRNNSLLHLMMGGPVPEHVLSFINASLSSNTLNRLQQQQVGGSPATNQAASTSPQQQQQQQQQSQQLWSPNRPSHGTRGSPGSSWAWTPGGSSSRGQRTPPARPASAGCVLNHSLSGSGGNNRSLVRTTTQQARRLSTIDPTGIAGLAGGGAANKAAEVFRRHDSDSSGFLDAEEMMAALQDLGMLEGMKARQLGKFLSNAIREADVDQDGRVSLEEFIKYYERLARYYSEAARQGRISARRKAPVVPLDASSNDHLKRVFRAYCRLRIGQGRQVGASVQHINAAQFNQMCRDAGLLEPYGPLSQCAVDIVFTRCKPPGSRRLSFKEFLEAVASVAEEAGCSFDKVADALVVISSSSPPLSPVQQQRQPIEQLMDGEFNAAGGLLAAAAARGSLTTSLRGLRIQDLTDTKVGPLLPGRASAASSAVSMSYDSSLTSAAAQAVQARAGPDGQPGRAVWGSGAGRGGSATPPSGSAGGLSSAAAASGGSSCAVTPGIAAYKSARLNLNAALSTASTPTCGTGAGAGVRLPGAAAGQQQQERQVPGRDSMPGRDAVQNPLYEGDGDGNAEATPKTKALEQRLAALEGKLDTRATDVTKTVAGGSIPAGTAPGDLMSRLLMVEVAVTEQQQQLSAVVGQQEALKEVVTRLVESLEGANITSSSLAGKAASAEVLELTKQVKALSLEVAQLRGLKAKVEAHSSLEGKLQELSRKTEDRQTRSESALYKVARHVDDLDLRLREEQESSMRALEAILANASPAK